MPGFRSHAGNGTERFVDIPRDHGITETPLYFPISDQKTEHDIEGEVAGYQVGLTASKNTVDDNTFLYTGDHILNF